MPSFIPSLAAESQGSRSQRPFVAQAARWFVALMLVANAGAADRVEVFKLDFGPTNTCAPGYQANDGGSADPRFLWKGHVSTRDRGGDDLVNRDFVEGGAVEFLAGLDNGDYELTMTFGDKNYTHGPFQVFVQDKLVVEKLTTKKAEFVSRTCLAHVEDARLKIKFVPVVDGANFAITSLVLRGPKQMKEHSIYAEGAPPKTIPTLAELAAAGNPDPRKTLKAYCDWLIAHRTATGLLEQNSTEWYRTSYPLRTLLAGFHIFGERKYLEAATACLDKLVGEQLPNSAWSSACRNRPVVDRTAEEVEKAIKGTTNTADVGSIATCLAVAYPYVDARRQQLYRAALQRYAENYAAQWQLPTGAFTNGRWLGMDMKTPYSVATGTQGMSFCALYAITGDARYLKIAERAAGFLLDNWLEDGRPVHHHHQKETASPLKVTAFGDVYYYHEAILWVWHWTQDAALKDKIERVYGWHIKGAQGLLQARENGVWWPVSETWANSKAAAMPLVLLEYDRSMAKDREVHEAVKRCVSFLCHPAWAERIGVMCPPEMPWGKFAMPATGFAGLTLAEVIEPGVIYLRTAKTAPSLPLAR
jgi:hypothetical protein